MRSARFLLAGGAAVLLAGCSTLGGNVKGDFQCSAPGGTCAPTSTIDDQAISSMTSDASVHRMPASDPMVQDPDAARSPGALKVVLPAQQDRDGHWRNQSVVYVQGAAPALASGDPAKPAQARLSLSDLAAGAPELAMFDTAQPVTTADIRRKVEATLAGSAAARAPIRPAAFIPPARTPAITLPGETIPNKAPVAAAATPAMVAAAKSDVAAKVMAGPGLPVADGGDD